MFTVDDDTPKISDFLKNIKKIDDLDVVQEQIFEINSTLELINDEYGGFDRIDASPTSNHLQGMYDFGTDIGTASDVTENVLNTDNRVTRLLTSSQIGTFQEVAKAGSHLSN